MGNCTCGRSNRSSKKDSTILTEEEIRFLLNNTKLNREQINALHYSFLEECQSGKMYKKDFLKLFKKAHPSENRKEKADKFCDYVFRVIDSENRGYITFKDFLLTLNLTSFGDFRQKCEFAFKLYDLDKDGKISKKEMTNVLESIYDLSGIVDRKGDKAPAKKVDEIMTKLNHHFDDGSKRKRDFITQEQFIEGCFNDSVIKNLLIDSIFSKSSYDDDSLHSKESLIGEKSKLCFLCAFKTPKTHEYTIQERPKTTTITTTTSSPQIRVANVNLTEFQPVTKQFDEKSNILIDSKSVSNYSYPVVEVKQPTTPLYTYQNPERISIATNQRNDSYILKLNENEVYQIADKFNSPSSKNHQLIDSNNVIPIEITIRRGSSSVVETKPQLPNYITHYETDIKGHDFVPSNQIYHVEHNVVGATNYVPDKELYITVPAESNFKTKMVIPDDYHSIQDRIEKVSLVQNLNEPILRNEELTLRLDEKETFDFVDKCLSEMNKTKQVNVVVPDTFEEVTHHNIDITLPYRNAADLDYEINPDYILEKKLIDDFIVDINNQNDNQLKKKDVTIESVVKERASTIFIEPVSGDPVNIENVTTDIFIDVNPNIQVSQMPVQLDSSIQSIVHNIEKKSLKVELDENPIVEIIEVPANLENEIIKTEIIEPAEIEIEKEETSLVQNELKVDNTQVKENNSDLIPLTKIALELKEDLKNENLSDVLIETAIPSTQEINQKINVENNQSTIDKINPEVEKKLLESETTEKTADSDTNAIVVDNQTNENKPARALKKYARANTEIDTPNLEIEPDPSNNVDSDANIKIVETVLSALDENNNLSPEVKSTPGVPNVQESPEENQKKVVNESSPENKKEAGEIFNIVTEIVTNVNEDSDTEIVVETKNNETIVEISSTSDFEMKIKTTDDNGNNIVTTIKTEQASNNDDKSNKEQIEASVQDVLSEMANKIDDEINHETTTAVITGILDKLPVTVDIDTKSNVSIDEITVEIEKSDNQNVPKQENDSQNEVASLVTTTVENNEVASLVDEIVNTTTQNSEIASLVKQIIDSSIQKVNANQFDQNENNSTSIEPLAKNEALNDNKVNESSEQIASSSSKS